MYRMGIVALVSLCAFVLSCGPGSAERIENNKKTVRALVEAVNSRDNDRLDQIFIEGFTRHSEATPDVSITNRDQMKQFLRDDLKVFPDSKVTIARLIGENDFVAGEFRYEGTQKGKMGPFPASGKSAAVRYLAMMRMEQGKIAEMWVEWDNLSILSQLGHFPPKSPEPE